jgi:hypothetical protein
MLLYGGDILDSVLIVNECLDSRLKLGIFCVVQAGLGKSL